METNHSIVLKRATAFFLISNIIRNRKDPNKHAHLNSKAQIKKWCIDGAMQRNYKLLQAVTLIPIHLFDRFSISLFLLLWNVPVLPRFRHLFMWFLLFGSRVDVYVGSIKRNRKEIHRSSVVTVAVNFFFFHGSFTICDWCCERSE